MNTAGYCKTVAVPNKNIPIILDDALGYTDPERLKCSRQGMPDYNLYLCS